MPESTQIEQILDRWEIQFENGVDLPIDELCKDSPALLEEVAERVRKLKRSLTARARFQGQTLSGEPKQVPTDAFVGLPFQLLDYFDEGGMGIIYTAEDTTIPRRVVIKQLKVKNAPGRTEKRFVREAFITAQLSHPGVAPIYGFGRDKNGQPYYAMRLVQGASMREAIQAFHAANQRWDATTKRKLAFRELIDHFIAACQVIDFAHSKQVIHRDIKPHNIRLGKFGETIMLDWGLAKVAGGPDRGPPVEAKPEQSTVKLTDQDTDETLAGDTFGTPAYMSPEQAQSRWEDVGIRSDIFSLGATLYQLLTGCPPFESRKQAYVCKFELPRALNPSVPRDLEAICLKAMRLDPEDRYASVADLVSDLNRWLGDEAVSARREPLWTKAARWLNRHRTGAAAALVLSLTCIVALSLGIAAVNEERKRTDEANRKTQQANVLTQTALKDSLENERLAVERGKKLDQANEDLKSKSRDLASRFYVSRIRVGEQLLERGELLSLQTLLQTLVPEPKQEDMRGFEWYYLRQLAYSHENHALAGHDASVNAVAISPDGTRLAAAVGYVVPMLGRPASESGEVKVWDLTTNRVQFSLRGHAGAVVAVAFSRDGNTLATGSTDKTLRLWDATTGKETAKLTEHQSPVSSLAYSPDGKWLATAGDEKRVFLRDARTGISIRWKDLDINTENSYIDGFRNRSLAFRPKVDGALFITNGRNEIHSWDVTTDKSKLAHRLSDNVTRLAFASDGDTLAVNSNTGRVTLIDLPSGKQITLQGHARRVGALAFSAKGDLLATGSDEGNVKLWDRCGRERAALLGVASVNGLAFCPSDGRILIGRLDGTVTVWNSLSTSKYTLAQGDGNLIRALTFLPKSEEVVVVAGERYRGGMPGEIKIWDRTGGLPARILQGTPRQATDVAISPDGTTLAVSFGHFERQQAGSEVEFYDLATGEKKEQTIHETMGVIPATAYSPRGNLLAIPISVSNPNTGEIRTRIKFVDANGKSERKLLLNLEGIVLSLLFSPDGRKLVAAAMNPRNLASPGEVQVWDVETGKLVNTLAGSFGHLTSLAMSSNGKMLATGELQYSKGILRLWDLETGRQLRILDEGPRSPPNIVAFSPDDQSVAIAQDNGIVRVRSIQDGAVRFTLRDFFAVQSVTFSPDGKHLATASIDAARPGAIPGAVQLRPAAAVRLWDAATGKLIETFRGYAGLPTKVIFSPDSKSLVSRGSEGTVAVWDVDKVQQERLIIGQDLAAIKGHVEPVVSVVVSPDGKTLYSGSRDASIKVWDLASGRVRETLSGHKGQVAVLAISPDGKLLASGSGGPSDRVGRYVQQPLPGEFILWDTATLTPLKTVSLKPGWVGGLVFMADGKSLAVGIGNHAQNATVRYWDLASMLELPERRYSLKEGQGVDAFALDRQGARLAVASTIASSGAGVMIVEILDLATGKRLATIKGHTDRITAVTFSPDGKTIATASSDQLIKLWQASSGEELLTLRGHSNWVNGLAFSPSGEVLASGGKNGDGEHGDLFFWNAPVALETVRYHDEYTEGFARELSRLDEQGNLKDRSYFDMNDKPLLPRALVVKVFDDSQGKRVGIKNGDILRSFNGQPIHSIFQFIYTRRTRGEGDLILEREGVRHTVHVRPGLLGCQLKDDFSVPGTMPR